MPIQVSFICEHRHVLVIDFSLNFRSNITICMWFPPHTHTLGPLNATAATAAAADDDNHLLL